MKENAFFVYEGDILRAVQPTFNGAMKYFKTDRTMFFGTAEKHNTSITNVAIKFKTWNYVN